MVSQTGKYALRILGHLVDHQGTWVLGKDIAAATGIPANYLGKVLNQLRKAGYVRSQKGWGGGFMLAPAKLRAPIAGVLEAIEGKKADDACVFELRRCSSKHPCPLHEHWQRVRERYGAMLAEVTIGSLAGEVPE
jgi:Rrf2 family transcriptional regulator, iron-sulfur cluster assembly transcription factor